MIDARTLSVRQGINCRDCEKAKSCSKSGETEYVVFILSYNKRSTQKLSANSTVCQRKSKHYIAKLFVEPINSNSISQDLIGYIL